MKTAETISKECRDNSAQGCQTLLLFIIVIFVAVVVATSAAADVDLTLVWDFVRARGDKSLIKIPLRKYSTFVNVY